MRVTHAIGCVIGGLMLMLGLSSCVSDSAGGNDAGAVGGIFGQWSLVSVNGESVDELLAEGMRTPGLQVNEEGDISGFAGVNRFGGKLDLGLVAVGGFSVGPIVATKMAGPPAAMELEKHVLAALGQADRFTVAGDRLSLLRGDDVLLVYQREH